MLAPLNNEVIFKIAFTDIEVFTYFVKDILDIDVVVTKIETEKRFSPKMGNIDFAYDIFAESVDHRVIIEIQKVEFDYHFDRFLLYHNMAIAELQRNAKEYKIEQEVYTIVILTNPYKGLDKKGKPITDEVLISRADPRNLMDQIVPIFGHKLILLNPHHKTNATPQNYRDWLDLIYESVYNRENYEVNLQNKGVKKVIQLIEYDNLTPVQIRKMKEEEGRKVVMSMYDSRLKEAEDAKQKAIEDSKKAEEAKQKAIEDSKKAEEEKQKAIEDSKKAEEAKQKAIEDSKKAEEEKQKAIEDSKKAEEEKQKAIEDSKKAEEEKQRLVSKQASLILKLHSKGTSIQEIAELTGSSLEDIQAIIM